MRTFGILLSLSLLTCVQALAQPPQQVSLPCFDDVCTTKFDVVVVQPITYTACGGSCTGWAVFYIRTSCGSCEIVLQEAGIYNAANCPCEGWQIISDAFRAGMESGLLPTACTPPKDDCISTLRLGLGTCYAKFDENVHDPTNTALPNGRTWIRCPDEPCCSGEYELCRDNNDNFTVTRTDDPGTPVTSANCEDLPNPPLEASTGICYNYCFSLPSFFQFDFTAGPKVVLNHEDGDNLVGLVVDQAASGAVRIRIPHAVSDKVEVLVSNSLGEEVYRNSHEIDPQSSVNEILVPGSAEWVPGTYVYAIIVDEGETATGKVQVQ